MRRSQRTQALLSSLQSLSSSRPRPFVAEMDLAGDAGLASLQPAGWVFEEARAEPRVTPAATRAAKRSGKRKPFFGNTQPCPKQDPVPLPAGARAASRCSGLGVEENERLAGRSSLRSLQGPPSRLPGTPEAVGVRGSSQQGNLHISSGAGSGAEVFAVS